MLPPRHPLPPLLRKKHRRQKLKAPAYWPKSSTSLAALPRKKKLLNRRNPSVSAITSAITARARVAIKIAIEIATETVVMITVEIVANVKSAMIAIASGTISKTKSPMLKMSRGKLLTLTVATRIMVTVRSAVLRIANHAIQVVVVIAGRATLKTKQKQAIKTKLLLLKHHLKHQ